WCAAASEGGHAGMALPRGLAAEDRGALKACDTSWEDLVSGIGLARLYRALGGDAAVDTPEAEAARADDDAARAVRALDVFSLLLGAFAGDAVLMFAGRGGCFLAGGLLTSIGGLFKPDLFLKGFRDKDRFSGYMADIPVFRITHPQPALAGLGVVLDRA
ncbi:MAG: glucokinase, partial [Rhodospirillaceae bacterium]|nr:glucokinase [Rhodospirillaceae bacterium]